MIDAEDSVNNDRRPVFFLLKGGFILLLSTALAGCVLGRTSPADIKPVYRVLNSPLPVPSPRWNPKRSYISASANTRVRSVGKPQTRKPAVRRTEVAQAPVSGTVITVAKGDTLYSLARKNGVPLRSMIAANGLRAPYGLAIGQKLKLPVALTHKVVRGDTGYSISRRYGVNIAALMRENDIGAPYTLSIGQVLKLPGGARPAVQQTASASGVKAAPRGRVVPTPRPPARSSSGFGWPVGGKLASRFGPKEGGLHNDGINILAKQGTPVRSAESGVVVYASNALEGYGNLLLLKHADGWLTAYAHNERLLVNEGDRIAKGQIIARVGATGGVSDPQLHFEIRKGRRALDPLDYLKSQVAAAR